MSITTQQGEFAFAVQYSRRDDNAPENKKARGKIALDSNTLASHTVTLGAVTYAFQASPAVANDVKIGATAAESAANLAAAINGTASSNVYAGTQGSLVAWADAGSNIVYVTAWTPNKTVGNAITLSKSGANITLTAFAGGITGGIAQKAFGIASFVAQPSAADTVVVGAITYEFVSGAPATYATNTCEVRIGSTLAETCARFAKAIGNTGVAGTEYSASTPANSDALTTAYTDYTVYIQAVTAGTAGNSVTFTETGSGVVLSAATLLGGSAASTFQTSQLTWIRTRSSEIDYSEQQMQSILPPEIGGTLVPTGAYKAGVNVRGGATLMPRLEGSIGHLLLAALGKSTTTVPVAGVGQHVFTFNTNEIDIPWVAVRRMIPGRDEVFGDGLLGWDNKVNMLRMNASAAAPIQAMVQFTGLRPEKDNHPETWVGNSFEDFKSIPLACKGDFLLPTLRDLPRSLPITNAVVELANVTSSERDEMIIGSYFMDDTVPLQRAVTIRATYKWRDAKLAQYLFGNASGATAWAPAPFVTETSGSEYAFDLLFESPFNITGTAEPYSLRIRGNYVTWQTGPMRLRPGEIITMDLIGTVLYNSNGYVEWVLRNGNTTGYSVPSEA